MKLNARNILTSHKAQVISALIVLAITVALAHYFHFREFGLYEDDYKYIGQPIAWDQTNLITHIQSVFLEWPQGRPLGFVIPQVLSYAGWQVGGLPAIYGLGYCILVLNAWLFYLFLRSLGSEWFAFSGAIAFALFPADTTKPLLIHAFQLQTSVTFFLIASLCYRSGKAHLRGLSYLLAFLCLLTHEELFLPFLALPLLEFKYNRAWLYKSATHWSLSIAVLFVYGLLRIWTGEGRLAAASANATLTLTHSIAGMLIGPVTAIFSFPYRFATVFKFLNSEVIIIVAILFVALLLILSQHSSNNHPSPVSAAVVTTRHFTLTLSAQLVNWFSKYRVDLLVAGVIMLSLAYAFSFTHYPPTLLWGRLTSVHLAASVGAAVLVGWLCESAAQMADRFNLRWLAIASVAFFFSTLAGFGLIVQDDYVKSWQNQQKFWTELLPLIPDVNENTLVFVVNDGLPKTKYILTHSWATPITLEQLFQFRQDWSSPPRVFIVKPDWKSTLKEGETAPLWWRPEGLWSAGWVPLPSANLILIDATSGKLVRQSGSITIYNQPFELKSAPSAPDTLNSQYETLPLYNLLIQQ